MKRIAIFLSLAALLLLAGIALASGSYTMHWWTIDSGGETFSTGEGYSLGGTIGQPDAGPALSGGDYTLGGSFWGGAAPVEHHIYLPLVLRNY